MFTFARAATLRTSGQGIALETEPPAASPAATARLPTEGSRPQKPTRASVVNETIIWSREQKMAPKTEESDPGLSS